MWKKNFSDNIKSVFTLDLRAIALVRIALSMVLLTDIIFRMADLRAFYSGVGVLPIEALFRYLWTPYSLSLFNITEQPYLLAILFAIYTICVCSLMLGYKTRWSAILVWIFLISLHNRNPLIIQAGDHLLRMMVFWGIFLPWGYLYSLDSLKNLPAKKISYSYKSFAGFAYICQIIFLYYFSALLKDSPEWRTDFTAIYYALSLDQLVRPVGTWIYPYYDMLTYMTAGVYYLELVVPLLLIIPFYNAWIRILVILAIASLQFGIFLTMNAGLFSITSVVLMIGLLPTVFLDRFYITFYDSIKSWQGALHRFRLKFHLQVRKDIKPPRRSRLAEGIVSLALVYVLGWNMLTIGKKVIPDNLLWVGELFKLHQQWNMFSPSVYKDDGWFIYLGSKEDGTEVDLIMEGRPVSFDRPERMADRVKNDRWRKYGENIIQIANSHFRLYLCDYLLLEWNRRNPDEKVVHLQIIYMLERTLPDYQTEEISRESICYCYLVNGGEPPS